MNSFKIQDLLSAADFTFFGAENRSSVSSSPNSDFVATTSVFLEVETKLLSSDVILVDLISVFFEDIFPKFKLSSSSPPKPNNDVATIN